MSPLKAYNKLSLCSREVANMIRLKVAAQFAPKEER